MPPIPKYTKEEITSVAFELVRKQGYDLLTARDLAQKLNTSTRPIFTAFENMDELKKEIIYKSAALFDEYKTNEIKNGKYPEYKARGMAYIRFAKEEKELFKLLFMRDRSGERIEDGREELRPIIEIIMKNLGISEDEAYILHLEMWRYVHGIATMVATSYLDWDMEFISRSVSDAYSGLKQLYTEKN